MPAPATIPEFLELIQKSGVADDNRIGAFVDQLRARAALPTDPKKMAGLLIHNGFLTYFQAEQFLQGKWKRFTVGKYKILERIGSGGMGQVFLCEHKMMRRRVAVKVLPTARAGDSSALGRFQREARAVAALDHPNIVRAYDIDQDGNLHFLVMEYVDGSSLQEMVKKGGPMDPLRACHYIRQSAIGLQHAYDAARLIHRDIKPGNILVDRQGVVKILDMGLARFSHDEEDQLTKKHDETVLGTADYLAPEQAMDSHAVDIRADIYSLGATFYFLLTGQPPFPEGSVAQKLIWHQTKEPRPIRELRPAAPPALVALICKMTAKKPEDRFQMPADVAEALVPWTQTPIPPPPEHEMPHLSPAALGPGTGTGPGASNGRPTTPPPGTGGSLFSAPTVTAAQPTLPGREPPRKPGTAVAPAYKPPPDPLAAVADSGPDETAPVWETLDLDSPRRPPASAPDRRAAAAPSAGPGRRRVWVIAAAAGGLVGLIVVVWLVVAALRHAPAADPNAAHTLNVSQSGAANAPYRTIAAALEAARPGDRIVVVDEVHEETLTLVGSRLAKKDLVIEGGHPDGKRVSWRYPATYRGREPAAALIDLTGVEGIRVKGFDLDGLGQVKSLVYAIGTCPGLTLEDLKLQNFARSGVFLGNATGDVGRPMVLNHVRVLEPGTAEAGLDLFGSPKSSIGLVRHLTVEDSEFEGQGGKPACLVRVRGAMRDVTIRGCALRNAEVGVRFAGSGGAAKPAEQASVESFALTANRFERVGAAARMDEAAFVTPLGLTATGNSLESSKEGNVRVGG
jgi:serine/threonine protein kinase